MDTINRPLLFIDAFIHCSVTLRTFWRPGYYMYRIQINSFVSVVDFVNSFQTHSSAVRPTRLRDYSQITL